MNLKHDDRFSLVTFNRSAQTYSELYKIKMNTDYIKTDLSKNLTGETEKYQLQASTTFEVESEKLTKKFLNYVRYELAIMKNYLYQE